MNAIIKVDKKNGISKSWYVKKLLLGDVKEEKADSIISSWGKDSQLVSDGNYKDGKKDGKFKIWHKNGQLKYEYNYKEGQFISNNCWDEEGKEIKCPN